MTTATRPARLRITDVRTGDEYSEELTKHQVCEELRRAYGGTLNDSRLFARKILDANIDVIDVGRERIILNLAELLSVYPKLRVTALRARRYGCST